MLQQPRSARKRISPSWGISRIEEQANEPRDVRGTQGPPRISRRLDDSFLLQVLENAGRGSWIRTNDLQYPKLPRYQAALYPECPAGPVDTRFKSSHQGRLLHPQD